MKRILISLILVTQVVLVTVLNAGKVFAANSHSGGLTASSLQQQADATIFSFMDLGYSERTMTGPYDTATLFFSLPPTWKLTTDATLILRFRFAGGLAYEDSATDGTFVGGTLRVVMNRNVIATIVIDHAGDWIQTIPLTEDALEPAASSGRHTLSLLFDASHACDAQTISSTLIISAQSQFDFQHQLVPPLIDLSKFPRPFYQPRSIIGTDTTIVVADDPSAMELQAALTVAAGFGSLTSDIPAPNLMTQTLLNEETLRKNHLIFVGSQENFAVLKGANFPVPAENGKFSLVGIEQDDGIIQMAVSAWNPENVMMLVSGNSEAGILKAAQALGTSDVVPVNHSNVSVISSINMIETHGSDAILDRTFADLGYENTIIGGSYGGYASFDFTVSPGQSDSTEAYLEIATSHSNLLSYEKSGITIFLNGTVVGSVQYDGDAAQSNTTRLYLLPGNLRRGTNTIEIVGDLVPRYNCYAPDLSSTLVTIGESSLIHIPASPEGDGVEQDLNLKDYPYMFLTDEYLRDLVFVLAPNDPVSWDYAARVAYGFGTIGDMPVVGLRVMYATDASDEILNENNLVIFGVAEELPIIAALNDSLPSPFEPGSNEAVQPSLLVNYRLVPGVSVGYLQLLVSPWNADKSILAVMGNNSDGIPMAARALLDDTLTAELKGNFSVIYGEQILTTDTRLGLNKKSLISELPMSVTVTPSANDEQSPISLPVAETRPSWILPALIVLTLLILALGLFLIRNALAGSRPIGGKNRSDRP